MPAKTSTTTYFYQTFALLLLGGVFFLGFKQFLPDSLFVSPEGQQGIVVDSLMLSAIKDAGEDEVLPATVRKDTVVKARQKDTLVTSIAKVDSVRTTTKRSPAVAASKTLHWGDFDLQKVHERDSLGQYILPPKIALSSYKGEVYLTSFFNKLQGLDSTKKGQVRIAYFGDSMIDGDLIVQDLRVLLQNKFGGKGVGFVPVYSESAHGRYSVKSQWSGNWLHQDFMKGKSQEIPFGIYGGGSRMLDSTAQIQWRASSMKHSTRLYQPRLYYRSLTDKALQLITDQDTSRIALPASSLPASVALSSKALKKIELMSTDSLRVDLYGIDSASRHGVIVDGFSKRGNSGLPLSIISQEQLRAFDQRLDYDLIILQYGTNVMSNKVSNYSWYTRRMQRVLQHLQQAMPETPILVLGVADKGKKIDQVIQTDSAVVRLLKAQQKYAMQSESGFISLYHLMGGANSMPAWVELKKANPDYTHFSPSGSKLLARRLYGEIIRAYHHHCNTKK